MWPALLLIWNSIAIETYTKHSEAQQSNSSRLHSASYCCRSSAVKVNEEIEKLHVLLKQAETAGASEASATAAAEAARVSYDLQTAAAEVQKAKAELMILGEQEKALQDTREVFIKELKAVMPELLRGQSEGTEKGKGGDGRWVPTCPSLGANPNPNPTPNPGQGRYTVGGQRWAKVAVWGEKVPTLPSLGANPNPNPTPNPGQGTYTVGEGGGGGGGGGEMGKGGDVRWESTHSPLPWS